MGLFQKDTFDNPAWKSVLSLAPNRPSSRFSGGPYEAGIFRGPHAPPDPRFDASLPGLGYDPYRVFVDYVFALQGEIAIAEHEASNALAPIVSACQTQ